MLAHLRVAAGHTQAELARLVFVSESKLASIEQGRRPLTLPLALERQSAPRRERPLSAGFVFSEAVLRDRLGGREVRDGALRHLWACADLPGVSVQVMPLGQSAHAGLSGPFVLFETPQFEHLAYAETQRGGQLIYDADEVGILARKYAMLRTQALNSEDAKGLLERLPGE